MSNPRLVKINRLMRIVVALPWIASVGFAAAKLPVPVSDPVEVPGFAALFTPKAPRINGVRDA